jgi:lipopolysaccharide export LptBFGC system permease protein LptF
MSRTLFWYIFKDLFKVFSMASGALAGIMSFVALLRPLTQNGLDGSQVLLLIRYFMPAMSTYSIPVAALFATTVVYGRMSADNEITACRASGISFAWLTMPAILLGILVAIMSLYFLCFTVPNATMRGEQVIYSNLAKLIAHQIEQTHQTGMGDFTVFAQEAYLPPEDPVHPDDQVVVLRGPLIMTYDTPPGMPLWYHRAKEFWSSGKATAFIHENATDSSAQLTVALDDGVTFPRDFSAAKTSSGAVRTAQFGPIAMPSPLAQKTKFMSVYELEDLRRDPSQGKAVKAVLNDFIREDQETALMQRLMQALQGPQGRCELQSGGDTYSLSTRSAAVTTHGALMDITGNPVLFRQESGGQVRLTASGPLCNLTIKADPDNDQAFVSIDIRDAQVDSGEMANSAPLSRKFTIALPPDIAAYKLRTVDQYIGGTIRNRGALKKLLFTYTDLANHIISELNGRAAFVVSCLFLVVVGSSLGMMFRSGNFLTAFAVSVIPAMLSTVLIVTGQHTVEGTPKDLLLQHNAITMGIAVIWSGNLVIGIGAVILFLKLARK